MWGYGDKYWEKIIYDDLLNFCKKNDIEFSVDSSIAEEEGAAGIFIYRTKENFIALKNTVKKHNDCVRAIKVLDPTSDAEFYPYPSAELEIKLDGESYGWLTFLHEIGHFLLYKNNIKQTERHADHYRVEYFKDKPKWLAWQMRKTLSIFAHLKESSVIKYLGLNPKRDKIYNIQNWYYKKKHKKGEWSFV